MANNKDFYTVNTGGQVVSSTRKGTDEKLQHPVEAKKEEKPMEEAKGFAKASPNVPKFAPQTKADKNAEKEAIAKNSVPAKKDEEDEEQDES